MKVVQKGWDGENLLVPIVLMDRVTRDKVGVNIPGVVTLKHEDKIIKAVVNKQFKALKGQGVTVNLTLACLLGLNLGDEVEVTGIDHGKMTSLDKETDEWLRGMENGGGLKG